MPTDFSQWLMLILIALLFGKDNLLPAVFKWIGVNIDKKNDSDPNPEVLAEALKKVLVEDDNSPILVKARISRICDDIASMKEDISIIKKVIIK